ncbi:hypothetical protein ES705_40374 [subsurface metagenome]
MKTQIQDDLSLQHGLISDMFPNLSEKEIWEQYRLDDEQVKFYNENGYLSNIKVLDDGQIKKLCVELDEIKIPTHPKHDLFYEFHTNESADPHTTLFHSLGHWRITEGFHDILWNPRFVVVASQLLGTKTVRFWSSRQGEFHPEPLPEPYVTVSRHTALLI